MKRYFKFFAPAVFLISLILLNMLRTIPNGKLWNSYSVLYVSSQTDDAQVQLALKNTGIEDFVSLSGQFLPVNLDANSVEISMFRLNADRPEYSYHHRRNAFFFDKSNRYRLYYVPSQFKNKLSSVASKLNSQKIQCGIDSSATYPYLLVVFALAFFIVLTYFSKQKVLFALCAVPPFVYLLCNPFYQLAVSNSLFVLCLFFFSNLWQRKNWLNVMLTDYRIPSMAGLSVITAFSGGIKSGFSIFLVYIAVCAVCICFYYVSEFLKNRKSFIPVLIKPARLVSLYAGRTKIILLCSLGFAVVVIVLFFLSFSESLNAHFSKLVLPSSKGMPSEALPQLEDYYRWTWNLETYPYVSLNENNSENHVEYPHYEEDENGLLVEKMNVLDYNQSYKEQIFSSIDNLPFNPIEKVMKSEGSGFRAGYASTGSYHVNLFGIIMMFCSLFILLFIYISITIRKGLRK